jgi:hypothetical protein
LLVALLSLTMGCKDDAKPKPTAAESAFKVDVDASDYVKVGFGGDQAAGGVWDEVSLQGNGSVRWTHVDGKSAKTQHGFDKRGKLEPTKTAAWIQAVVDDGLYDLEADKPVADAPRMTLDATLDGKRIQLVRSGQPDSKLQARLDELMATTLESK